MTFQSSFPQLDLLIRSIASRYKDTLLFYMDYEDLVQEGRLAALKGFKRWMRHRAKRQATASMSSWVYLYVNNRFKELAGKAKLDILSDVCGDDIEDEQHDEARGNDHDSYVWEMCENAAMKYILRCSLPSSNAADRIDRTPQRVAQLQKHLIENWTQEVQQNDGTKCK
ncbi:MAG: hypothetical protein ABIF87_12785 [Pseudomonadota bacterium]